MVSQIHRLRYTLCLNNDSLNMVQFGANIAWFRAAILVHRIRRTPLQREIPGIGPEGQKVMD